MKINIILLFFLVFNVFSLNFTNVQTLQKATPESEFAHSAPMLYDFDDNGQKELWIGCMQDDSYGTVRIYPASNPGGLPVFDDGFSFLSVNGTQLKLLSWT